MDSVRESLTLDAATLFDSQIASTELVQRQFDDSDVYTYPNRRGPQRHDAAIAFPNRATEVRLATVHLRGPLATGKVTVDAVLGHVFQLKFRPSPKRMGKVDDIVVTKTTVHVDPMLPDDGAAIDRRLESLDPMLRSDLEGIWRDRPGWAAAVANREEIYSIDLDDGTYLVLAQLPDTTFVAARTEPGGPGVKRFDPEGDLIGEYPSLREAITSNGPSAESG